MMLFEPEKGGKHKYPQTISGEIPTLHENTVKKLR